MYDELSSKQKPAACLAESEGFSFDLYMTKDDRYLLSAKSNAQVIAVFSILYSLFFAVFYVLCVYWLNSFGERLPHSQVRHL